MYALRACNKYLVVSTLDFKSIFLGSGAGSNTASGISSAFANSIFTSFSPIVDAFDWDNDGSDDSIDTDDDNDSILDIDDQCTPGQVDSYSLGMRDHDSDGCDDHLMFISNAFLEGDGTDVINDVLFDSNDNQIVSGYSLGNYSKFQNYNITTDPVHQGYSFVSKINFKFALKEY